MIDIEKLVGEVSEEIKKGSTRLVYFPVNKRKIILDEIEIEIETVLKVAKSHTLELNTKKCDLGKFQNTVESNFEFSQYNAFLKKINGEYETNYNGILSPIFHYSKTYNWIEMFRVYPLTERIFQQTMALDLYPNGLYFSDVVNSIFECYTNIVREQNTTYTKYITYDKYDTIIKHPWVRNYISWMIEFNMVPWDLVIKNFGYIEHPISKKKIIVLCDYGYSEEYEKFFNFIEQSA